MAVGDSGNVASEAVIPEGPVGGGRVSAKDRIEIAQSALTNAEKCRNWREKRKLEGPEFLKGEAARMRKARGK